MAVTQFNIKPETVAANIHLLTTLQEGQKLCSDKEGNLSLEERPGLVSFILRKFGSFDFKAVDETFTRTIEILRQNQSGEGDKSVAECAKKINLYIAEAVNVGLARLFRTYKKADNEELQIKIGKLILEATIQYNYLERDYQIAIPKKLNEEIAEALIPLTLKKKTVMPVAPVAPKGGPKPTKKTVTPLKEAKVQEIVANGLKKRSPVGFVLVEGLGQIRLASISERIFSEKKRKEANNKSGTELFDQAKIDKVRDRKRIHGAAPTPDPKFELAMQKRRERIEPTT